MNGSFSEQDIVSALRNVLPRLLAVYLFGSQAQASSNSDSDIDLAILAETKLEPLQLWDLAQALAKQVGRDVDLLDLRAASTVMQYQIITTGKRLWEKDSQAAIFESAILSEKTALDTARAGLMSDIQREGSVYGG